MSEGMRTGRVAISTDRHGGRFWRRFESYAFARELRCVPVVLAEIEQAASAFPLVFRRDAATGAVEIVALLNLTRDAPSPFVGAEGGWRGTYVPSGLRAHPFSATPTGEGGEMALLVDEASGLVTDDPRDEPFFDAGGAPSEALEQVIAFFRTRAASEQATRAACAALDAAGLLTPLAPLPGMHEADARGFLAVDAAALGRSRNRRWRRCGTAARSGSRRRIASRCAMRDGSRAPCARVWARAPRTRRRRRPG